MGSTSFDGFYSGHLFFQKVIFPKTPDSPRTELAHNTGLFKAPHFEGGTAQKKEGSIFTQRRLPLLLVDPCRTPVFCTLRTTTRKASTRFPSISLRFGLDFGGRPCKPRRVVAAHHAERVGITRSRKPEAVIRKQPRHMSSIQGKVKPATSSVGWLALVPYKATPERRYLKRDAHPHGSQSGLQLDITDRGNIKPYFRLRVPNRPCPKKACPKPQKIPPPAKKGHPLKTWHPKTWHLQHLQGSAVLDLSVTTLSEVHSMSKTM